jgi:hypothetical protein
MRHSPSPRNERGAVLIVALIMLAVMTLFVISMLKTSVLELKIGGISHVVLLNLANAESAVDNFIALNSGRFAPNFLGLADGAGGPDAASYAYTGYAGSVTLLTVQLGCGAWAATGTQMGGSSLQAVQFDVAATATGQLGYGGTVTVHQGLQTLAAPGSC